MEVRMTYFDPANGQAMGLEQRIAELFKADPSGSIEILELGKSYNRSQVDQLMTDVTEWFQNEASQHRMEICSGNYSDISAFLSAVECAFKHSIPPVTITFSTLEDFWACISSLKEHSTVGPHYTFSCKANERGLFLNLKEWEIRRYGTDSYPMSFQFKDVEDFYKLPLIYGYYNPVHNEREIVHNEHETVSKTANKNERMKKSNRYILIAAVIVVIAGLYICFSSGGSGKADADHYSRRNDSEAVESSRQNDSETVESSRQKSDNGLKDSEIKKRLSGRSFVFSKSIGADSKGWVIMGYYKFCFNKGGRGVVYVGEEHNGKPKRVVDERTFSWKVANGKIYVTDDKYNRITDTFTYKPGYSIKYDRIVDCMSGDEYKQ